MPLGLPSLHNSVPLCTDGWPSPGAVLRARQIVAAGCLFLAGKVNDEPIPAQHIVAEMFKRWYGRDNPAMRLRLTDNAFVQNLYSSALEAEHAILYTVGFDFNVDLPHTHIAALLRRSRFKYLQHNTHFHQLAINFCNDIMRKDGTMVLQYTSLEIALAVYYYIFKAAKRENLTTIPQPEPEADGTPWFIQEGLAVERCSEITQRMNRLYLPGGAGAASSQPAASAATTVMPGLSVRGGDGAESAAGGSAAVAAAVAGQEGAGGAVESAPKQPSTLPQQAPPVAGQKRSLEDAGEQPAAKAAREEPPGTGLLPPDLAAGGVAGPPAEQGPVATQEAPAAPAQPAEGSDKEEGELEEGELA